MPESRNESPLLSRTRRCPPRRLALRLLVERAVPPALRAFGKGYEIEVFSPNGGKCEPDAMSDPRDASGFSSADVISMGFIHTPNLMDLVENTQSVSQIDVNRFNAILVAGGQAPMFTFESAAGLHKKFVEFYEAGKIAAAVCHGVAILRYVKLSNGEYLAKGKTVTGFANIEEDFVDESLWSANLLPRGQRLMPWRIEDELKI